MKTTRILLLSLLGIFASINISAQCALACPADLNIALDPSGNATLTAEQVLESFGPSCGTLVLEPSTFDCSDIGSPVPYTVTDLLTGNNCSGNIHVRYFVGAMACTDISVVLPPSGELTLTTDMMLIEPAPECLPGAIITPPTVSCADIGSPVLVSVADPVSGNSCFSNVTVSYNVGIMACLSDISVVLPPSGELTLTTDMILVEPSPECLPGAIINPPTVSCADIGSPVFVTITDPVSGNSCWSNVTVSYNVGAMSCFADVSVQLDASGNRTLTSDMLLFDPPGACIPGAIISPSSVSCGDIGSPVFVTITDPVSGNSCWSNVTVDDPEPASCDIVVPSPIYCGDSGVMFSVNVTGGYGPYTYDWKIKGNPNGWSITSGQGTDVISMAVGNKKIKLEVTVTGICGKKRKCSVKLDCEDPPAFGATRHYALAESKPEGYDDAIKIYPNPASDILNVRVANGGASDYQVVDQLGRAQPITLADRPGEDTKEIYLDGLSPGLYWLIIRDARSKVQVKVKKFIKTE